MKKLALITASSIMTFFGATQGLAADLSNKALANPHHLTHNIKTLIPAKAVSTPHINLSLEGFHTRANGQLDSMLRVTHNTNEADPTVTVLTRSTLPKLKSSWNWGVDLSYTFDDQSDVSLSYRHIENNNTTIHTYNSMTQIASDTTTSSISYTAGGHVAKHYLPEETEYVLIGGNGLDKAFAFLSAVDTLTEKGEITYQQMNTNWGHTFTLPRGFSIHPYVGLGWRSMGYKDSTTFQSIGAFSDGTPTTTSDYILATTSYPKETSLEINDIKVLDTTGVSGSGYLSTGVIPVHFSIGQATVQNEFSIYDNAEYDSSDGTYNLANLMPSYTSKFRGIGPRLGLDGMYTVNSYVSVTAGLAMTMPYAKLKTSGYTTDFTIRDLAANAASITTTDSDNLVTNVNLQATSKTAFNFSSHKIIPEIELNLGLRLVSHTTQKSQTRSSLMGMPEKGTDYYLELGYRFINDWSAIKNIDLGTGSLTTSRNITNKGPYLKAGINFSM